MRVLQPSWGAGRGPLRRLAPESRLIAWAGAVAGCILADPTTWVGLAWCVSTLLMSSLLTLAPARVSGKAVLLAVVMLGPVFVLAPFTEAQTPQGVIPALAPLIAPFRVFVRGLCVLVLTSQVMATLTRSEFRDALARLPIPPLVGAIVQQVLLQTELQTEEVRRIGLAMRARGATRGIRNRLRIGFGMPRVWLGRLLFRAQRNAQAMEARGFTGAPMAYARHPWRGSDFVCLVGAFAWCAGALWLRVGGGL